MESLPNARINTGKDHSKSSKVVHTFAVICDTLSDLLHFTVIYLNRKTWSHKFAVICSGWLFSLFKMLDQRISFINLLYYKFVTACFSLLRVIKEYSSIVSIFSILWTPKHETKKARFLKFTYFTPFVLSWVIWWAFATAEFSLIADGHAPRECQTSSNLFTYFAAKVKPGRFSYEARQVSLYGIVPCTRMKNSLELISYPSVFSPSLKIWQWRND